MHVGLLPVPAGAPARRRLFPGREVSFRRAMVVLTLIFWAGLYVLFTLRSLGVARPLLAEQALCRLAMMPVGLTTCAALYLAATRAERLRTGRAVLLLVASLAVASVFYAAVNFFVFYVAVTYWESRYSPGVKIALDAQDFLWIFSTWLALFYLVRFGLRSGPDPGGEGRSGYLSEIWVRHGDGRVRIDLGHVSWLAAEGDYVRIHADGSSHMLRSTTSQMERQLDPARFIRIHRGAIVALSRLKRINRRAGGRVTVTLDSGLELPVGRAYLHGLRRLMRPETAAGQAEDCGGTARPRSAAAAT